MTDRPLTPKMEAELREARARAVRGRFLAHGMNHVVLNALMRRGLVRNIGLGEWQLVNK